MGVRIINRGVYYINRGTKNGNGGVFYKIRGNKKTFRGVHNNGLQLILQYGVGTQLPLT